MLQENVDIVRRWLAGFNEEGLPPFDLCDERIEIRTPLKTDIDSWATAQVYRHPGMALDLDQAARR